MMSTILLSIGTGTDNNFECVRPANILKIYIELKYLVYNKVSVYDVRMFLLVHPVRLGVRIRFADALGVRFD